MSKMQKIPIPNNAHTAMDISYRYIRDKLDISKAGEYYIINNLDTICKDINVEESDIISFIPKHLNQAVKKISGKVGLKVMSEEILEDMLETYIVKHIICSKCSYPEIEMNKTNENYMICKSCGQNNSSVSSKKTKDTKTSKKPKELKKNKIAAKKQAIANARKSKLHYGSESDDNTNSDGDSDSD